MCLKVFVDGNDEKYKELEHSARMLGAAFQKVNFLRDIQRDLNERGRIYLPVFMIVILLIIITRTSLRQEVENEFSEALKGIKKLPI